MRAGSWRTFEHKFKPMVSDDGSYLQPFRDVCDKPVELVWTVIEAEGKMYCAAGFHVVNRIDYLLCEKPWTPADELRDYVY